MHSRRKFIKKTALASAGIAISSRALSLQCANDKPLGIGIIGTGDRGGGLARLMHEVEGLNVVAMCDIIPFRLEKALTFGNAKTKGYSDYRRLLENKKVDAVIIATPFSMHANMAIDALDAGKHAYCEKTLAYGIEPTKKLLKKARESKMTFQTGHQYHSSRLYRRVVEMINKGYLGEISLVKCQWNRNGDWRRPVPDPKWEKMINWRMYREYSGGLTAELCSHQIDFTNWLLNDHPAKVAGFGGIDYWKDGRETYDNVHILTEYPNGVKATYTSLTTNAKNGYRIQVLGKKGSIVIEEDKAWIFKEKYNADKTSGLVDGVSGATMKAWEEGEGAPINVSHKHPSIQALMDFRDNIRNGEKPLSDVETGAKVSVVVQMAMDAMDNNRVELWKPEYG